MGAPFQILDPVISLQASADLSASQFCALTMNSSQQVLLPSANATILGVLQNNPNAQGKAAEIQIRGVTKAKMGGTVTTGDTVKVDSSGRFVTASGSDITSGFAVGMCILGAAVNQIGSVTLDLAGSGQTSVSGTETVTSGALSLNTIDSQTSTTGTVAYTLANGLVAGQLKRVREITAASTPLGTLTITTPFGSEPATHVFTAQNQELLLEWTGAAWRVVSKIRAGSETVVVGTTVLTGHDMCLVYNLSVTGTVTSSGSNAIPNSYLSSDVMYVRTTTAASTPNGTINIAGFTKAEVAATAMAGINATTCTAQFIGSSDGWHNVNVTTATYS
jgi:hypothetical protein